MKKNFEPLNRQLDAWKVEPPLDPDLKAQVMQRIAWEERSRRSGDAQRLFGSNWPLILMGGVAACVLLLIGSFAGMQWAKNSSLQEVGIQQQAYLQLIDPVARLQDSSADLQSSEVERPNLVSMLSWMQGQLNLSKDQFVELVELHQQYELQFEELYRNLLEVRRSYDGFESLRANNQMIDFVALYDLLERRRALESDAHQTSGALVKAILQILDSKQGQNYLAVLDQAATKSDA